MLYRSEATDHQQQRLWGKVILIQPVSLVLYSVAAVLVVAIIGVFLFWGQYAKKERVQGYLVPTRGLVKLYAERPGSVTQVSVHDGDRVSKDQTLLVISARRAMVGGSDVDTAILGELETEEKRLEDSIGLTRKLASLNTRKLEHKITGLRSEISKLKRQRATQTEQVNTLDSQLPRYEKLRAKGYLSVVKYEQHYQDYLAAREQVESLTATLSTRHSALTAAQDELAAVPDNTQAKVSELRGQISDLRQQRAQTQGRRSYAIKAPVAGRVTALQADAGQSVTPQRPVLAILPQDARLRAHLFVPTRAIGFVKAGQHVELQYQAFPHERFGIYDASVTSVADAILSPDELPAPIKLKQPVYRVKAALKQQTVRAYGKSLPLDAGMLLDADIILEHRSLIDWLLDPLYSLSGRF